MCLLVGLASEFVVYMGGTWHLPYSQTLENKSSLAPKPLDPDVPVAGPVLLVHPPNSSSAATLGCVTRPPEAPGTMDVLAREPPPPLLLPHPPKSPPNALAGCGLGALGAGSGVAQALPPHTSAPDMALPPVDARGLTAPDALGAGGDLGWERLKTELSATGAIGAALGAAAAGAGLEKSNRSFMADDAGAAGFAGAALGEAKSPKPPKPLLEAAGLGAGAAAAGLLSKKLPPLRPENAEDCCGGGDLLLDMEPKPANAEFCVLFGLDMLEKLRLLKASFNEDWAGCWLIWGAAAAAVGEPREPKDPECECDGCC